MMYYMTPRTTRRINAYQPVQFNGGRRLPVDVRSDSNEYVITAVIPGLSAEDLKIEILEDVVTVHGEISAKEEVEDSELLVHELYEGSFSRSLRFPEALDADSAEAQLENGVLKVRIQKSEAARPKVIEVKAK
jgi:HSP20 family protein